MEEQRESEEQEDREEEEDDEENQTGDSSDEEQPAEDDTEPGSDDEEAQGDEPYPDVLESIEEAGTQADLSDDDSVGNSTATVKVVLVPDGHVITAAFAIGLSIGELKEQLATELRVPAEVLQISLDGLVVEGQQSLMELGVRPHASTRMEMSSTDPHTHPLRVHRAPQDNQADLITVRVQTDAGESREVVVEIERPAQRKAFLGGYRHTGTGTQYHHASAQTQRKARQLRPGLVLFSRDTQTVSVRSEAQQCPADVSTQMTGIGCYVSCERDRLVAPGYYLTADEFHHRRLMAVVCLQSYVRRWLAQQEVGRLRCDRDRRLSWQLLQERRRVEEKEEQLQDRRHRWMNPQRREDFNLLYHALEKWRCEEEQRINQSLVGAERKAALYQLLEQETQLIAAIGRHRIAVLHNNYDKVVRTFLNKCASPHKWRGQDGRLIELDSVHTIRARVLKELYNRVHMSPVDTEQRHDTLMELKQIVTEYDCQLTRDTVELIDRELDLMSRGVSGSSLGGLRKRINTLFLQFFKTPAFNPEVAKLLKVPQNPSKLKDDMFQCCGCRRYLNASRFGGSLRRCVDCSGLDNIARCRTDSSCYRTILLRLRADERLLNPTAKMPFLLQVEDIRYLVEVVWASRSALHNSSDLYSLVLVRWLRDQDWSPWNCLLLSKEEKDAHMEVEDVHKAYEAAFVRRVEHKQTLARRHFSQMAVMAEHLEAQPSPLSITAVTSASHTST